jgi:predicted phage tail protein
VKLNRIVFSALAMSALVLALAGCGSKSASLVGPGNVIDTTPPAAPTSVSSSYDAAAGRDYLNWTPSTSADVASYQVWKYEADPASGATGTMIMTAGAADASVALSPISSDGTFWFRVRAIDESGNQSAFSSSVAADLHAWDGSNTGGRGDQNRDGLN